VVYHMPILLLELKLLLSLRLPILWMACGWCWIWIFHSTVVESLRDSRVETLNMTSPI